MPYLGFFDRPLPDGSTARGFDPIYFEDEARLPRRR